MHFIDLKELNSDETWEMLKDVFKVQNIEWD